MSKLKQLNILDLPSTTSKINPVAREYINPLTGSIVVQPEIQFNELIEEVSIKYSKDQFRLQISLRSSAASTVFTATYYPILPVVSFKTAIPDYVRFNIVLSLTEDFAKQAIIRNVEFYPSSTSTGSSQVSTFTESAKISQSLYETALLQLFYQYSFEEVLETLPEASSEYSPSDFNAKQAHFYERAEFTRVYFKVQLSSARAYNSTSEQVTYSSKTNWLSLGIISIDTKVHWVLTESALYSPETIYRQMFAYNLLSFTYKIQAFNREFFVDSTFSSSGYGSFKVHPTDLARLSDYQFADTDPNSAGTPYSLTLAKLTTVYGVSVDLLLYDSNSPEYTELLSRLGSVSRNTYNKAPENSGWPTHVVPRLVKNSYMVDNLNPSNPLLSLVGITYVGTVDIFGNVPAVNDRYLQDTPIASYSAMLEVNTPGQTHRKNYVARSVYKKFSVVPEDSAVIDFVPVAYRSDNPSLPVRYEFFLKTPINQTTGLINGFTGANLWTRNVSLNFEYRSLSVMGDRRRAWLPDFPVWQVVKGVIKQFALKSGVLKKTKTAITLRRDVSKTKIPYMPSCKVYLRRYVYSKVGKIITYTPGPFLLDGILNVNKDGFMTLTDSQGNDLSYEGSAFSKGDQLRLLADFKNLQDFYGIRSVLGSCDETQYIEIARLTV